MPVGAPRWMAPSLGLTPASLTVGRASGAGTRADQTPAVQTPGDQTPAVQTPGDQTPESETVFGRPSVDHGAVHLEDVVIFVVVVEGTGDVETDGVGDEIPHRAEAAFRVDEARQVTRQARSRVVARELPLAGVDVETVEESSAMGPLLGRQAQRLSLTEARFDIQQVPLDPCRGRCTV